MGNLPVPVDRRRTLGTIPMSETLHETAGPQETLGTPDSAPRPMLEIDDPEAFQDRGPRHVGLFKKIVLVVIGLEFLAIIWFLTRL